MYVHVHVGIQQLCVIKLGTMLIIHAPTHKVDYNQASGSKDNG